MVAKLLFTCLVGLLLLPALSAQKNTAQLSVGIESHFLIAGEINSSFDFLVGFRGLHYFHSYGRFQPFLSTGFATDIAKVNARMLSVDIQFGTNCTLNKRFSLLLSGGANYLDESHTQLLIERKVDWQKTTLGITGNFGINYRFSKSLFSTLSFRQTNLIFTAIGLGFSYSF